MFDTKPDETWIVIFNTSEQMYLEVHAEPCQISKMEIFMKIVNG